MFWQVVTIEQTKLFKRAILWVELALLALGVIALHLLLYFALRVSGEAMADPAVAEQIKQTLVWPAGLENAANFAAGPNLGGLLLIVLVGAAVAQEYSWRTFQLWLSRGVPRPLLITGKFTALLLPIALFVLVPLVAGGVVTAFFSATILGAIPFGEVEWGSLLVGALKTAYSLLPYAGLAFFLAVLSRSTIVAVGGGLATACCWKVSPSSFSPLPAEHGRVSALTCRPGWPAPCSTPTVA
jgi:ABC-type transport system involved in multi-copper enzyme maturation permease subunit